MQTAVVVFEDRRDAGRRLAAALAGLRGEDVVVLGLPRGGIPVAFEVARGLDAPLDALVVRKLGVPFEPELGMGAVGEGGVTVVNETVVQGAGVSEETLEEVEARERTEVARRSARLRAVRPEVPLSGRTAVVVDDGLATGSTARAACTLARAKGARRVVLAVPVAAESSAASLRDEADEVVVLAEPEYFLAIGQFYRDFSQTSDAEVIALLEESLAAEDARAPSPARGDPPRVDEEVEVVAAGVRLAGRLVVPTEAEGLVVFAHGS
ncbi:MAG TPA: phosphoribosyltransferase family protein, partial [Acidimicrobiales bacterium]|nr:phosphoribosyltransferase family protein [Acidimicrobiales bacterium]